MNYNKISAMLQANKVWTIIAMMGFHVNMRIYDKNNGFKGVVVKTFCKDDNNLEKLILETIHKNWNDGDTTETEEYGDFRCITYTTKWTEE